MEEETIWRKTQCGGRNNMEEYKIWRKTLNGIRNTIAVKQIWRNNGRRYNMEVKHKMEEYKFGGRNKMEE